MNIESVDSVPALSKSRKTGKWHRLFESLAPGQIVCVTPDNHVYLAYRAAFLSAKRAGYDIKLAARAGKLYVTMGKP